MPKLFRLKRELPRLCRRRELWWQVRQQLRRFSILLPWDSKPLRLIKRQMRFIRCSVRQRRSTISSASFLPRLAKRLKRLAKRLRMPKAETALFKKILNPSNHFPPIRQTKFSDWNLKMKNDLPKRKPNRLNGFDYSSDGAYFITICTKNKEQILSRIVYDKTVGANSSSLTPYHSK